MGIAESGAFGIRLAIEEALANALKHGSPKGQPVHVDVDASDDVLTIAVEDHGPGFDPASVPDPTTPENLSKPCGRGLLLIRTYMSEVRFNDTGNRIEMVYRPPADRG